MSIIEMETQIMPYDVRNKGCFKINTVTNMDKSKAGIPNLNIFKFNEHYYFVRVYLFKRVFA